MGRQFLQNVRIVIFLWWLAMTICVPCPFVVVDAACARRWHRTSPGCTIAQANVYFFSGKEVVFLGLGEGAVLTHAFSSEGKESKGPVEQEQEATKAPFLDCARHYR